MKMTKADVIAHQEKHGFSIEQFVAKGQKAQAAVDRILRPRMNKTETEFSRILDVQKARGEIVEWRYQGIRLPWGMDPKTGQKMHYKPDFYVVSYALHGPKGAEKKAWLLHIKIIEVKGAHIWKNDKTRFRGCRAEWPMFDFELWQKKAGNWSRLE